MGAGDWVTGGVRRAVSGVAALLPGAGAQEPDDPQVAAATEPESAATPEKATAEKATAEAATPPPQPPTRRAGTARSSRSRTATGEPPARKAAARASETPTAAPATTQELEPGRPAGDQPATSAADAPSAAPTSIWSAEELEGFRSALDAELARLREELDMGEADLADLVADSGDGSGDDQADAGSKTFEREHEMSVNANTREMIDQALRARARLEAGTYGICERCGTPIAIGRLRAYPRATLCIRCKQAEERR